MNHRIGNATDFLEWREGMGNTVEIYDIQVNSERGKGIGRNMFEKLKAMNPGKNIYAFTRKSNFIAQDFYRALRFEKSYAPGFYPDESAYLFIYRQR